MHALDNPVWHALTGMQRTVAERHGDATRYEAEVAPFSALPDDADRAAWVDLAALVGPGGIAVLLRDGVAAPRGWDERFRLRAVQMVAGPVADGPTVDHVELTAADVPEAAELVELTQPGPFGPRTIELGAYLGVRSGAQLVALAGERMRIDGHTEISAVCTHPGHRGKGHAAALVRELAGRIAARGDRPFLHCVEGNDTAIHLYRELGFTERRRVDIVGLRPPRA